MKVILKETVDSLGIIGSEVSVADGYARNYLLPQGKAVKATPQMRKIMAQQTAKFEIQIAKEKKLAEEMAEKIENVECTIRAKVIEGDRLYGSVTLRDILSALADQEIKIEKRMLMLNAPLKALGSFKVPVRIYKEVEPNITVHVVPES